MDKYLEELIKQDNMKLLIFLESAITTINLGFKPLVKSINKVSYKNYDEVLNITYKSGKEVYINIDANSIQATARELFRYITTEEAQGLIEVVY
jgi:hypothetical protein